MKNQQEIFLKLLKEHRGILKKVTKIYMDNQADREDLEQEIIFQLWRSYERFTGKSKFSTWMYRVALNTAITYFKKEKRRVDKNSINDNVDIKADEHDDTKDSQLVYFYKAVQELNKVEKALILLFIEGQSHKEIGENLGLTEGNARVKLNRTKKKIQQIIKDQGYEF
ncbi:MAG: sigma-70 family RNA polymerase sigma factor [Crocinitomix sp.]|nr:sigma-70 family RNA polymerase sigma factor [Crocinitomix sp.]